MNLIDEQWDFVYCVSKLIVKASELNYILTFGEAWRPDSQAWINSLPAGSTLVATDPEGTIRPYNAKVGGAGILKSVHTTRLAIDFNVFKMTDTSRICTVEETRPLGEYWKSLHIRNRWGGDFVHPRPDAPHFERSLI